MSPPDIADIRNKVSINNPGHWLRLLKTARKAMGGNLSRVQTFMWKGRLVRHIHYYPRQYPTQLQRRMRSGAPERVLKTFIVLLLLGLPLALFFAWAFEITPEGIKREEYVDRSRAT